MKKINLHFKVILLISIFLIVSKNIYSQWIIAGELAGLSPRPQVSVVDGNTAFVSGGESVNATYRTTNGGMNWTQLNTGTFGIFWSIWAKDANTVFGGANGTMGGPDTIKLYKTTNGGNNWEVIASNFAEIATFTSIKFSNSIPSFGIAIGGAPNSDFYTYKTRDGGNTWTRILVTGFTGMNSGIGSLNVIDSLFYAIGSISISPSIIITTDGGVTWNLRTLNVPSSGSNFTNGVAFKEDKLTGIAASSLPIIARTTNGGLNWVNINVGNNITGGLAVRMRWIEGTNICYLNTNESTAGGVLKSTNGGINWTSMTTSGLGGFNIDTKRIGSNVYGYANSSFGGIGGNQVLKVTDMISGINQISELVPDGYNLSQNYPNPFNPVTNLEFRISKLELVSLKIYNMLGKEIAALINTDLNPGTYIYHFDASALSSGVYFYKLQTDNFSEIKKMTLMK